MFFLGDKIRYLRETKEIKQKDMALHFSVKENTWSQYETNNRTPDLQMLKKIATFFNVSVDYLLDLTREPYDPTEKEFKEIMSIYTNLSLIQKKELVAKARKILSTKE